MLSTFPDQEFHPSRNIFIFKIVFLLPRFWYLIFGVFLGWMSGTERKRTLSLSSWASLQLNLLKQLSKNRFLTEVRLFFVACFFLQRLLCAPNVLLVVLLAKYFNSLSSHDHSKRCLPLLAALFIYCSLPQGTHSFKHALVFSFNVINVEFLPFYHVLACHNNIWGQHIKSLSCPSTLLESSWSSHPSSRCDCRQPPRAFFTSWIWLWHQCIPVHHATLIDSIRYFLLPDCTSSSWTLALHTSQSRSQRLFWDYKKVSWKMWPKKCLKKCLKKYKKLTFYWSMRGKFLGPWPLCLKITGPYKSGLGILIGETEVPFYVSWKWQIGSF